MKHDKLENLMWIIFGFMGLIFLLVTGAIFKTSYVPKDEKIQTTATIIDIDYNRLNDDYDVLVLYNVDGVEYTTYLNYYLSSFSVGDEITIQYDINNPSVINSEGEMTIIYIFGGLGLVFIVMALIFIGLKMKKKKLVAWLKENGNIVNAKYLTTKLNANYMINNEHPYVIVCEWINPMDNKLYQFNSKNIWFNPEEYINSYNITSFKVYVNPNNPKQYYVDVDFILENGYTDIK